MLKNDEKRGENTSKYQNRQRKNPERNLFLSDEGPMLETLDYTIRIGSKQTFLYFFILTSVCFCATNSVLHASLSK